MSTDQMLLLMVGIATFVGGFACGFRTRSASTRGTGPKGGIEPDGGVRPPPTPRPPTPGYPYKVPPAPPPAHIAEHSRDCPIYKEWLRSVSCEHCGERISQKKPATTEWVGGPR